MSKHDNSIITEAAPHTIKKFELISNYVDGWARKILGYGKSRGIIYIDCMSNSGVYTNNGNIVEGTAIRVAKELNEISTIIDNHTDEIKEAWNGFFFLMVDNFQYLLFSFQNL